MKTKSRTWCIVAIAGVFSALLFLLPVKAANKSKAPKSPSPVENLTQEVKRDPAIQNAVQVSVEGRNIFRFDTFGDQAFWGDMLQLHVALAQLTPRQVLALGVKVDVEALPASVQQALKHNRVNLDDPNVTVDLLKQNAVLGVVGTFNQQKLQSVGITCALCHSTVDNSLTFGVGHRLDGWANRDLNVGAIIAAAPNLQPFVDALKVVHPTIDADTVRTVLLSWGPGKFDAELILDGKAFRPDGGPAATLLPNAFGLAGYNQHTWTGDWGSVPYWNAFVAVLEMHGIGTFFDPRLDDTNRFPIAAALGFGHISVPPDVDQVTSKLAPLHVYQLVIPVPKPKAGVDFDLAAAARGDELFTGKANCNSCHREPLWTEPGWNLHTPAEMKIDSFQADRAPGGLYKTMNLAGLFIRERGLFMAPENKGRFYHDGRFQTLLDVVNSYNERFSLGLTEQEKLDLVEYLKSL